MTVLIVLMGEVPEMMVTLSLVVGSTPIIAFVLSRKVFERSYAITFDLPVLAFRLQLHRLSCVVGLSEMLSITRGRCTIRRMLGLTNLLLLRALPVRRRCT